MIKQNPVARVHSVRFAVIYCDPEGVQLRNRVRGTRMEGRGFGLRGFADQSIQLRRGSLVETHRLRHPQDANGFEQPQRSQGVNVGCVLRGFERDSNVTLRGEIVDFIGSNFLNHAEKIIGIGHVAVVQE